MRRGFTLLELVFVIVIFGIMSKFGADILYKIYENYVFSNTTNRLLNQSEAAVKQIANRLQYRIKDSTIARNGIGGTVEPIGGSATGDTLGDENVLEWIGVDIDGWRGITSTSPRWSGFIDLEATPATPTYLASPGTASLPTALGNPALFFIGSNVDLSGSAFGWDLTSVMTTQDNNMHIVSLTTANQLTPAVGTFSGINLDVYEYYQLAQSAYAVSLETGGNLWFYYNYQPWNGTRAQDAGEGAQKSLIMENVSSFKFTSMGDIMIIQVCVTDNNVTGVGEYSICKEKVVF